MYFGYNEMADIARDQVRSILYSNMTSKLMILTLGNGKHFKGQKLHFCTFLSTNMPEKWRKWHETMSGDILMFSVLHSYFYFMIKIPKMICSTLITIEYFEFCYL